MTNPPAATANVEELQRKIIELQEHNRDLQQEAKGHRLKAKEYRTRLEEMEKAKPASEPSAEIEALRKENRTLKHRGVFERVAREAGAKTSGKALDTLWNAIGYEADGDADPEAIGERIEAARAEYDFLFAPAEAEKPASPAPADDLNRAMRDQAPARPTTPATRPGPGVGRGAPADGTGKLVVRKSELQSFDPRVNPMLDPHAARRVEKAKADGTFVLLDE